MIEIKVSDAEAGQKLNKFLGKYLKEAPTSFLYKMLRKKNIVLNDKKAKGDEVLFRGDKIRLYLSDETLEKFRGTGIAENGVSQSRLKLDILYEDKDIMAVHKKPGVLSQKAKATDYSINEAIVDYVRTNKDIYGDLGTFKPSVCNRLDMNTSGIVLAGISLKGSQYLSKVLKDRSVDKYYYTIVKGRFEKKAYDVGYISKDDSNNISTVITEGEYEQLKNHKDFDFKSYSRIETEFIPVSVGDKCTLLKIKLITGKSHQIRAHLAKLGHCVAGDIKYGDKELNRYMRERYKLKNHLLHAGEVILSDELVIKDPLPAIFEKICTGEGLKIITL